MRECPTFLGLAFVRNVISHRAHHDSEYCEHWLLELERKREQMRFKNSWDRETVEITGKQLVMYVIFIVVVALVVAHEMHLFSGL